MHVWGSRPCEVGETRELESCSGGCVWRSEESETTE